MPRSARCWPRRGDPRLWRRTSLPGRSLRCGMPKRLSPGRARFGSRRGHGGDAAGPRPPETAWDCSAGRREAEPAPGRARRASGRSRSRGRRSRAWWPRCGGRCSGVLDRARSGARATAAAWVAEAPHRGALVLTDEASVAVWRACQVAGVRAATVGRPRRGARAVRRLGINLLVVEPPGKSISWIRQLGATFRRAGAPLRPEGIDDRRRDCR